MDTTREEILIGKVVDRCESPADWSELEGLAHRDSAVWQRLRATLRDDALVRAAVEPELLAAAAVELPRTALRTWPTFAGWLAAVLFAALWLFGPRMLPPPVRDADEQRGEIARDSGGRNLGELPPILVRSQPTEDGRGLRVVTMRRILRESVVDKVFQVDEDEFGDVRPVQVELSLYANPSDF